MFRQPDKVATYDEFKAIVDGCHLKPLDRKEDIDSILKPNEHNWNTTKPTPIPESAEKSKSTDPNKLNANLNLAKVKIYGDFERLWRKVKKDAEKSKQLLLDVDEKLVFRENCEPLDELLIRLSKLDDNEIADHNDKILSILTCLTSSKRFGISVAFMDNTAFAAVRSLLARLETSNGDLSAMKTAFAWF